MFRFLLFGFISFNLFPLIGQVSYPGKPLGIDSNMPVRFIRIDRPQYAKELKGQTERYKLLQFADPVKVDISPETTGSWQASGSQKVWMVGVCSPGASSLGITFTRYQLVPGVKVFVYPYSASNYLGAFTFRNNQRNGVLPISPLNTDSLVIEMQVPSSVATYGELKIGQVGLGYSRQVNRGFSAADSSISAVCNVDVSCYLNRELQIHKHAVCKIMYDNSGLCTGTLVNNTSFDGRPLVLTSAHCIKNDTAAQTAIFYFDYEKEMCNGRIKPLKSVAGGRLLARDEDYDFALIELQEKIPIDYNPVYAGWDIKDEPFDKSFTIHHPMGDVKKVSVNEDLVMNGRYYNLPNDNYWVIPSYEVGTTQAGSSGSALFDSVFHIKGILSYGGESCKPFIYDYYIRLDQAWKPAPDTTHQLAYWLNPKNDGAEVLSYYQPNPFLPYAGRISHVDTTDQLKCESYYGSGYVAGTNPLKITAFAEQFRINGSKYIYAVKLHVHRVFTYSNQSILTLKIWSGKNKPEKLIYQQLLLLFELAPEEYNLIRLDTMKLVSESFYVGFELSTVQAVDTFSMYYVERPSMADNTAWALYNNGWFPLYSGKNYISAALDMELLTFDYYLPPKAQPGEFPFGQVSIYPNPTSDFVQILFKNTPVKPVYCKIYDLQGRICVNAIRKNSPTNFALDVSGLKPGFYIVSVQCEWGIFNYRVMIRK